MPCTIGTSSHTATDLRLTGRALAARSLQVTGAVEARASVSTRELSFDQFLEILTNTEG
jgi:hypothetical protein